MGDCSRAGSTEITFAEVCVDEFCATEMSGDANEQATTHAGKRSEIRFMVPEDGCITFLLSILSFTHNSYRALFH